MNNQEYLSNMTAEQRRRHRIEGTAGILRLFAGAVEDEGIAVDVDTMRDDGKAFSFVYSGAR